MAKRRTPTPCKPAADYRTDAPRSDGWTDERKALFLLTLAQTGIVAEACKAAEMSESSAYSLRRQRRGALFALGWKAAHLLARDVLADDVMAIARTGAHSVVTKADGVTHRTTISTGPLLAVINRLDRRFDSLEDHEMAIIRRLCAGFDRFIDVILMGGKDQDFLAFLKRTPDPLRDPLAQVMQMESEEMYAAEAAPAPEATAVEDAVAPSAAPAAKRPIDPALVEESAIFSGAFSPEVVRELVAMGAMAPSAPCELPMAA